MVVFTCNGCSMGTNPCTLLVPVPTGVDIDINPDHCAWQDGPVSRWVKMDDSVVSKIVSNSKESK